MRDRAFKDHAAQWSGIESVRIQGNVWKPAIVTRQADTPRSYHVHTEDGGEYRRNCRHLNKTGEHHIFPDSSDDYYKAIQEQTPVVPPTTSEEPSSAKSPPAAKQTPQPYFTRHGRTFKPRQILDI